MSSHYNLITILGHTAAGKTSVAAHLAYAINSEVISADSRQVYRNMDIGTGKDIEDYTVNGKKIRYHIIDIVDAGYKYNVFEFQNDFLNAFNDITNRGKLPILCGGTGLYINAATQGYKLIKVPVNNDLRKKLQDKTLDELTQILAGMKTLHNKTDVDTKKRAIRAIEIEEYYKKNKYADFVYPEIRPLYIGIRFDRNTRRKRISERLQQRLKNGMIEEVEHLIELGMDKESLVYYGLEYKYLAYYVFGDISYDEMVSGLETAIHRFAKRQMTWFRGMERKGMKINWIDDCVSVDDKVEKILALL